jgi:hypothetical protein
MKLAANTGYVSLADVKKLEDQFEEYKEYESILQKRAEQKPTEKFSIPLVSLKQLAAKNGLPLEMSPVTEDQGTVLRDIKRTTKIVVVDEKGKSTTYLLNDLNGIKGLKNYTTKEMNELLDKLAPKDSEMRKELAKYFHQGGFRNSAKSAIANIDPMGLTYQGVPTSEVFTFKLLGNDKISFEESYDIKSIMFPPDDKVHKVYGSVSCTSTLSLDSNLQLQQTDAVIKLSSKSPELSDQFKKMQTAAEIGEKRRLKEPNTQSEKLRINATITKVSELLNNPLLKGRKEELTKLLKNLRKMRATADEKYVDPVKVQKYAEQKMAVLAQEIQSEVFDPGSPKFSKTGELSVSDQRAIRSIEELFPQKQPVAASFNPSKKMGPSDEQVDRRLSAAGLIESSVPKQASKAEKKSGFFSGIAKFFKGNPAVSVLPQPIKQAIPSVEEITATPPAPLGAVDIKIGDQSYPGLMKDAEKAEVMDVVNFMKAYNEFNVAVINRDEKAIKDRSEALLGLIVITPDTNYELTSRPCPTDARGYLKLEDNTVYLEFVLKNGKPFIKYTAQTLIGEKSFDFPLSESNFPGVNENNWKELLLNLDADFHDKFKKALFMESATKEVTRANTVVNIGDGLKNQVASLLKTDPPDPTKLKEPLNQVYTQLSGTLLGQGGAANLYPSTIGAYVLEVGKIAESIPLTKKAPVTQNPEKSTTDQEDPINRYSQLIINGETPSSPSVASPDGPSASVVDLAGPAGPAPVLLRKPTFTEVNPQVEQVKQPDAAASVTSGVTATTTTTAPPPKPEDPDKPKKPDRAGGLGI